MTDTPDYATTVAWLEKLDAASPLVHAVTFGHTAQGRALCAVIASREGIEEVLKLEYYRLVDPVASPLPFEGRHTLVTKVNAESGTNTLPAGTMKVSTDQPLGDLAIALLEPEHLDSLAAWGFVPEILQRTEYIEGYVIAPLAERMIKENPKLKAEFETRLAADPAFAKDSEARLQWFYERSPFHDREYLLYPVAVER